MSLSSALVVFSAPVFWLFFTLAAIALFILRGRRIASPNPFRVPLYPVIPILFTGICVFMLYASVEYAVATLRREAAIVVIVFVPGVIVAWRVQPQRDASAS